MIVYTQPLEVDVARMGGPWSVNILSEREKKRKEKQTGQMLFSWKFCNNHVLGDSVCFRICDPAKKKLWPTLDSVILYYECVFFPFWIFSRLLRINRLGLHTEKMTFPSIPGSLKMHLATSSGKDNLIESLLLTTQSAIEDKPLMQSGTYQIQIMVSSWARPTKQSIEQHKPSK